MSQIVIIEPNQNLQELISLNLKTYVGAEVIPRDEAKDTIALLSILPSIDLIICAYEIGEEKTAIELARYIREENMDVEMVVLGDTNDDLSLRDFKSVRNPKDWEAVIRTSAKILGFKEDVLHKKKEPDFIPIPIHYFYHLDTTCCDVFIRIKKGPEDYQFVKRIHNEDSYSKQMVQKYEDQGLKDFYIPRDMKHNFTNSLSDQLVRKIKSHNDEDLEESDQPISAHHIKELDGSFNIALNEIKELGFNSATIQVADSVISSMIKTVNRSTEVSRFLRKIVNSKTSYLYQHCHLTTIVASELSKSLGKKASTDFETLAYASFFKDITLSDEPDLAKISTQSELDELNLSSTQWGLVMNHAAEGAALIRRHPEAPLAADTLILTHHGSLDGRGFFTNEQDELSELSHLQRLFILSSDFVKELLTYREKGGTPRPIVTVLKERYPQESVVEILDLMSRVFAAKK